MSLFDLSRSKLSVLSSGGVLHVRMRSLSFDFIYGEFDPGSGRTLAACLRNASRTGVVVILL